MNGTNARLPQSPRWVLCLLLLTGILLAAGCGGGGGQATPSPSAQTTPASTRMLPIVTPTPNIPASPKPSGEQETASPAAESPGG